jgi:[acyl-carrier-protein] S-malonyltransferase
MGKLALIFPGQGSQAVGMGADLAVEYEAAADIYRRAGELAGWHVADVSFHGPEAKLNQTEFAQVALYVNSMAVMAVLREHGVDGDVVSGHSLGEYSALAAAGAVNFAEGLNLVSLRGRAMNEAARQRPGTMAAIIGLEDAQVEEICAKSGEVWPVNYNCPGQLVISGETESVRRAIAKAKQAGAKKTIELAVSGSFHSPLMRAAAGIMKEHLAKVKFKELKLPFMSSISCKYEDAGSLADLLVRQIVSPVRWRQAVERLVEDGVDRFLEVGSGKVLTGLIRRITRNVKTANAFDPGSLRQALEVI